MRVYFSCLAALGPSQVHDLEIVAEGRPDDVGVFGPGPLDETVDLEKVLDRLIFLLLRGFFRAGDDARSTHAGLVQTDEIMRLKLVPDATVIVRNIRSLKGFRDFLVCKNLPAEFGVDLQVPDEQ